MSNSSVNFNTGAVNDSSNNRNNSKVAIPNVAAIHSNSRKPRLASRDTKVMSSFQGLPSTSTPNNQGAFAKKASIPTGANIMLSGQKSTRSPRQQPVNIPMAPSDKKRDSEIKINRLQVSLDEPKDSDEAKHVTKSVQKPASPPKLSEMRNRIKTRKLEQNEGQNELGEKLEKFASEFKEHRKHSQERSPSRFAQLKKRKTQQISRNEEAKSELTQSIEQIDTNRDSGQANPSQ